MIGFDILSENDFLDSRQTLLVNKSVHIGLAAPKKSMAIFL